MTHGKSNRFLLLYASQTGQAKAIAEEVAEKAVKHGLYPDIHCVSNTEKKFWLERESCVVIISSTTGEGEPPETAVKFWRRLKKKTLPDDHLKQLNYILLGLGDTNYTNFCNFAKNLDRRLEELGAKKILPSTFADDAVGLEEAVEPWMDEMIFPALKKHLGLNGPLICDGLDTDDRVKNDAALTDSISKGTTPVPDGINTTDSTKNVQNVQVTENAASHTQTSPRDVEETNPAMVTESDAHRTVPNTSVSESGISTMEESLVHSLPPLSESPLTVPACPPRFLDLKYDPQLELEVRSLPIQNDYPFPSAKTDIQHVTIASAEVLTRHDSVKTALKLTLALSNTDWKYEPGDSLSIICVNPDHEVDQLLRRLEVLEHADDPCQLSVIEGTKKRNAAIPAYLGERGTLRHWFKTTLDLRSVPKKALLRALVEHTADPAERRRLQELCSKQGMDHYARFLRQPGLGLIDVLMQFALCKPPVALLLEHLPRLLPRSYSSASCYEARPGYLDFVFNIIEIPAGSGRIEDRQGICTGMLARLSKSLVQSNDNSVGQLTDDLAILSLDNHLQIPVFLRDNQTFHPPADLSVPLIMIGPGTGVAPFIGFLQQRELRLQAISEGSAIGETWLFFGCRHKDRDYLFRKELEYFEERKVLTHLKVCFSREPADDDSPRYVQDLLLLNSHDVVTLMLEKGCEVFVCGDAKNMAKDVKQAFVKMIEAEKGLTTKEAEAVIFDMLFKKRYHEDIWA